MLVNRKGIKVKEFSLREMTEAISLGFELAVADGNQESLGYDGSGF